MKWTGLLLNGLFSVLCLKTAIAQNYADEIARARNLDVTKDGIVFNNLELGVAALGRNGLSLQVSNSRSSSVKLTIEWKTNAGLSQGEDRHQQELNLEPQDTTKLEGEYSFAFMSPFAKLYISAWEGSDQDHLLLRERYHIGNENPALSYDLSKFKSIAGRHLHLYYLPGTLAEQHAGQILSEREAGLSRIEKVAGMQFDGAILLFLYPDETTKTTDTMHIGNGWAFNQTMVEIYNDKIKVNPFHEMTHVITSRLGSPPAMFDEGFAVYTAELLGSDALEHTVGPGNKIDEVAREYKKKDRLIPLTELITTANIGDSPDLAEVQYPESASFVKFLVETFGSESLRRIFSELKAGGDAEANSKRLEKITGKPLAELERLWLSRLGQ